MGGFVIDADTLDGEAKEAFGLKSENEVITGKWQFKDEITVDEDIFLAGNDAGIQYQLNHYRPWDEEFNGGSMPEGWSFAGDPFVTPGHISYVGQPGMLVLGLTGGGSERAFLYRTTVATDTYLLCSMKVLTIDSFIGIRLDDGSDSNYVEFVANMFQAAPSQWQLIVRHREDNGAVNVVPAIPTTLTLPMAFNLNLQITGTQWTEWVVHTRLMGALSAGQSPAYQTSGQPCGLTWTPTRRGIVIAKSGAPTWFRYYIDSFTPN